MSKAFLDTNIALYTQDPREPRKQQIARNLFVEQHREQSGVVSTQVLQEFYVIVTKRFSQPPPIAKAFVQGLRLFEVVVVNPSLIDRAIDIHILNQVSFWDGLILAAAEAAHCSVLLTEDLNHGQVINGVRVENPFR